MELPFTLRSLHLSSYDERFTESAVRYFTKQSCPASTCVGRKVWSPRNPSSHSSKGTYRFNSGVPCLLRHIPPELAVKLSPLSLAAHNSIWSVCYRLSLGHSRVRQNPHSKVIFVYISQNVPGFIEYFHLMNVMFLVPFLIQYGLRHCVGVFVINRWWKRLSHSDWRIV